MTTKSQKSRERSVHKALARKAVDDVFEGDEACQVLEILEKSPTDREHHEMLQEARRLFPTLDGPVEIKINLPDD